MHPIICTIGPLTVYSYGVMMALAVVVCSLWLSRDARRENIQPEVVFDLVFWVVCAGVLGARLFYVFLNFEYFMERPIEIIQIQNGGLAWQGGLILGTIVGILYARRRGLPLLKIIDLAAPYVALGHAVGRLGCFLNGCCYGKEVGWGIYFPAHHARLHPTQLYESVGLFLIFLILKKYQKNAGNGFPGPPVTKAGAGKPFPAKPIPGQVFILYLVLASLERFVVEFFRADHTSMWLGLSIFQWISLALAVGAVYAHSIIKSRFPK